MQSETGLFGEWSDVMPGPDVTNTLKIQLPVHKGATHNNKIVNVIKYAVGNDHGFYIRWLLILPCAHMK